MPQILNRFDIVGFDPRGVGKSTPLWCLTGPETDKFVAVDGSPSNEQQENDLINQSQNLARNCMERAGALLPFVGTLDAARDLDILRAVLGDKKLNMLGNSYGTLLA
jgi:pimeloyl-ACP methyl ester carboxylesterase